MTETIVFSFFPLQISSQR